MPIYQGIVYSLIAENKAEILIKPGEQSIIGAPEVSEKVCHECTAGSTLRIEAVNRAGAEIGDWVVLTRQAGLVKKNAMALFGMPFLGIGIGTGIGVVLMFGMGLPVAILVFCAAIGLVLGGMIGKKQYRALSEKNEPVINRIVKKRSDLAAMRRESQKPIKNNEIGCDSCSGCIPR
jgi:hypothetical protein